MEHFGDEVDITTIFIDAANHRTRVIHVLSDDTDTFVLLVYWLYWEEMECKVQMDWWDGTVLDVNATSTDPGPQI